MSDKGKILKSEDYAKVNGTDSGSLTEMARRCFGFAPKRIVGCMYDVFESNRNISTVGMDQKQSGLQGIHRFPCA